MTDRDLWSEVLTLQYDLQHIVYVGSSTSEQVVELIKCVERLASIVEGVTRPKYA